MREAAAAGITADRFWHLTYRELFNQLAGDAIARRRARQLHLWSTWHGAAFTRSRRMPSPDALNSMLRKMEPGRIMSAREQRSTILSIAHAMGAEVIHRKKGA